MTHRFCATDISDRLTDDLKSFDEVRAAVNRSNPTSGDCVVWRKSYMGKKCTKGNLFEVCVAAVRMNGQWILNPAL